MSRLIGTQSPRKKEPPRDPFFVPCFNLLSLNDGLLRRSGPFDHLKLEVSEANLRRTARVKLEGKDP
jgi:hypothetical protein